MGKKETKNVSDQVTELCKKLGVKAFIFASESEGDEDNTGIMVQGEAKDLAALSFMINAHVSRLTVNNQEIDQLKFLCHEMMNVLKEQAVQSVPEEYRAKKGDSNEESKSGNSGSTKRNQLRGNSKGSGSKKSAGSSKRKR